ncbi:hypothetical protein GCM10010320_72560 [Streptomyces caelestis]|uniref:Integrase n=1 Tax=Streptomyces caelestis TaxID=36816 RepID=A0A7W9GY63_9ACTN|nr:integrase [Streptomyces caelestis]GGW80012.1 hypothetical protein GCM10010320_72560 [Streptomyces caelestis]
MRAAERAAQRLGRKRRGAKIFPYALRHSFAQRIADADTVGVQAVRR